MSLVNLLSSNQLKNSKMKLAENLIHEWMIITWHYGEHNKVIILLNKSLSAQGKAYLHNTI